MRQPVLMRCPACGSKFTRDPRLLSREWWLWQGPWQVTAWLAVWRLAVPFWVGFGLVVVLVVPYTAAERRLRAALWRWRHPVRCQGGGEPEPVPDAA